MVSSAMPRGNADFEAKRTTLMQAFAAKVPAEYRLPPELIQNPPADLSRIPSTCGKLTDEEIAITENYDAVGLLQAIAKKTYTAVAVIKAFSKRAIIAHQLTCCLTQWFMEEAVKQATVLDAYLETHGKPIGPLHGLPVSIKDHMHIAGTFSSQGCFASIVKDQEDCKVVASLRSQGAIFYCKTNQPQSLMHLETDSHWGRVLNPYNIHLSAGGSTGGEAALIALRGSVMGIGTDIGGSIRAPSAFCGIYGFKPTSSTLSTEGMITGAPPPAILNIPISAGPMCRTLRDMDLCMQSLLSCDLHKSDPNIAPIVWTGLKTPLARKLKIGIVSNDGFVDPQPPVKRAIAWAKETLKASQDLVEVKDFTILGAEDAWSSIKKMYWPDGGQLTREAIQTGGEPIHPLTDWICQDEKSSGMTNAAELALLRYKRDEFRKAFAESWKDQDVDVIIGPAFVGPACSHDTALYWTYTSLYNLVDYPSVVFPTPVKSEHGEVYSEAYQPLSKACRHVKALWEDGTFDNAPVNLQLVAPRYCDNQLFGALQLLRNILSLH
jgi:amidase